MTRSSSFRPRRRTRRTVALVGFGLYVAMVLGAFDDDRGKGVAFGETVALDGGYEITMAAPLAAPDVPGVESGPMSGVPVVPGCTWSAEITITNTADRPMPVSELEIYGAGRGNQPSDPVGPEYDRWRAAVIAPGEFYRERVRFVGNRGGEHVDASLRVAAEPSELFVTWESGREPEPWYEL
ncbi:hypothetical protein [Saccharopolyspora mangrovi]|uniref:DUF4352 domain-containing protein n=1 Tax=Saccharopolyspora mangrovi TaxID=3082379 RepID=A0ABU6ABZ2_9PSEU|nr:hypothetical protein [Saccharopolyspora sp. S2-29]MEB3368987.1 hypothetical protein [Saccharopolyspora sp. S2-29]